MNVDLPAPIRAFDDAQRRAFVLLGDVVARLEAGMSERDVFEIAETRLQPNGFDGWFHAPHVWIRRKGAPVWPYPSARRVLAVGDLVTLDAGPSGGDAFGDAGTTVAFGTDEEPAVLRVARECVRACCGYASRWKTAGEIHVFARAWAVNQRMDLGNRRAVGHRVLAPEGWVASGFPRSARLGTFLARNQMHRLNPVRLEGMYAVQPQVVDRTSSATFEEVFYVREDVRVVLGRDGLADVGTLPGQPPLA